MKTVCGTFRAVTAIAGAAFAIKFDVILPMLTKDDGIGRSFARCAIHAELVKLVKLFVFFQMPFRPSV